MRDADLEKGVIISADMGGVIGEHPAVRPRPVFAAPTLEDRFNSIGVDIAPMACLNVGDVLFEFDSSVVREQAGLLLSKLPDLRRKKPSPTGELPLVSIFGHADATGNDDYNKTLAGRRARSVYGLLTHDPAAWEELYVNPFGGDDWSQKMKIRTIAQRVGLSEGTPRAQVFLALMRALCPEPLAKTDFLGRGADPGGKADYQGCGEFNPLFLLSSEDLKTIDKETRNGAYQVNRRVVIFLFRPEVRIAVDAWPCPRAREGPAGCRKRLFLNGSVRLAAGLERKRHFGSTDETFACRFYDRLAGTSPCEQFLRVYKIRLFDPCAMPMPGAPYTVDDGKRQISDVADADAYATVHDIKIPAQVRVTWRNPDDEAEEYSMEVHIDVEADDADAARMRLHNLGYVHSDDLADNLREFQRDHRRRFSGMTINGELDDVTRAALKQINADCDPDPRLREDVASDKQNAGARSGERTE